MLEQRLSHLLEDAAAPERSVELKLGEPEKRVPNGERIEDVRIENGTEDHGRPTLAPAPDQR